MPKTEPAVVPQQIDTLAEWEDIFPVLSRIIQHQITYSYATTAEEEIRLRQFLAEIDKPESE